MLDYGHAIKLLESFLAQYNPHLLHVQESAWVPSGSQVPQTLLQGMGTGNRVVLAKEVLQILRVPQRCSTLGYRCLVLLEASKSPVSWVQSLQSQRRRKGLKGF